MGKIQFLIKKKKLKSEVKFKIVKWKNRINKKKKQEKKCDDI